MKEQLDLVKILKDCPKGMELDCIMYDNVTLKSISDDPDNTYPICIEMKCGFIARLTKYGQNACIDDAKCVIFPKGKKTWEGFQRPFKDGDILYIDCNDDEDTNKQYQYTFILKEISDGKIYCYCYIDEVNINKRFEICWLTNMMTYTPRFVTEEEKQKFFNTLKENGYEWNEETKTLEKLIVPKFKVGDTIISKGGLTCKITDIISEHYLTRIGLTGTGLISIKYQDDYILVQKEKFDPKTLKPFDKVLVRDIGCSTRWHIQFFETMYEDKKKYPFVCLGGKIHSYCIPYNDDTKHLVNKMDEPSEFYRYWEN